MNCIAGAGGVASVPCISGQRKSHAFIVLSLDAVNTIGCSLPPPFISEKSLDKQRSLIVFVCATIRELGVVHAL